jgi:hypothetical protein
MKSRRTASFRDRFDHLPEPVQRQAEVAYRLFEQSPQHPSLHFKRVSSRQALYSVRIGRHHRALGLMEGDTIFWFWIGPHAYYDQLLKRS